MSAEAIYLISIWAIQAILYTIITFELLKWEIRKRTIFWIAVLLFLIAPMLFSVNNGHTKNNDCGLMGLVSIAVFWFLGNIGNLTLILVFALIRRIRKK